MTGFEIATDRSLLDLDERYRALYDAQAARLVPALEALTDEQWAAPSRNSRWTVQQTMQHVAGVLIENVRVIDGFERTWSANFDPHRSPQEDIDTRAGESPAETMAGYVEASRRYREHLATRSSSEDRRPMLWGEPADFRLFQLHLHWDAWIHERDMLLPLGIEPTEDLEALRFATAYGVLFAGVAVKMAGGTLAASLDVGGLGDVQLTVSADAIRVQVDPDGGGAGVPVAGAAALADALAGRGDVAAVVDGPEDIVGALRLIGAFIRG